MNSIYIKLNKSIYNYPFIKSIIHFCNGFIPYIITLFYGLFLLKIVLEWRTGIWDFIDRPLLTVLITILLKLLINRKRPYEVCPDIKPIVERKHKEHSFPSIHISYAISIALSVVEYGPNMSLLLGTLAITLCISRALSGSHYLSDILASIILSIGIYIV